MYILTWTGNDVEYRVWVEFITYRTLQLSASQSSYSTPLVTKTELRSLHVLVDYIVFRNFISFKINSKSRIYIYFKSLFSSVTFHCQSIAWVWSWDLEKVSCLTSRTFIVCSLNLAPTPIDTSWLTPTTLADFYIYVYIICLYEAG